MSTICLLGPSGSGKSTIASKIEELGRVRIISTTTRLPRVNEVRGKDYVFETEKEFMHGVENGKFAEYDQYCGNYYGTPVDGYVDNTVVVLTPSGVLSAKARGLDLFIVYVNVNEDTMKARMRKRKDSENAIRIRIAKDASFFAGSEKLADLVVDNNEGCDAAEIAKTICEKEKERRA